MSETRTPVHPVRVDRICDDCNEGVMRPTGMVLTSCPAQYVHRCTHCDQASSYTQSYPFIDFQDEQERQP